uniref:Uncharacterized protein n=1 Tax=Arundo donax TaxID=35708 RepID=A0A0A8YPI3_ARUDO
MQCLSPDAGASEPIWQPPSNQSRCVNPVAIFTGSAIA